jgi:hypothetical protein
MMLPPKWHGADYAERRLAEIKSRHYPNGDTLQMIADFDWLIDEVEYLRGMDTSHGQ